MVTDAGATSQQSPVRCWSLRMLLLHVLIQWECGISSIEAIQFYAEAKVATEWFYYNYVSSNKYSKPSSGSSFSRSEDEEV
ncbi:hypothetical protein EVAR_8929_1 [Eumeta japonica]|uniref:Uncharacterized protein n=1 Tax=Eumeta variegata TaxID=151549 RepID=A0A4C1U0F3_EUMVA|nr:hypothetical protein EVAR_8929_1 [Eumeta japonica]